MEIANEQVWAKSKIMVKGLVIALLVLLLLVSTFYVQNLIEERGQYGLVGLALVLFYMLLFSISEYTGFNIAYAIAATTTTTTTTTTIGLIGRFAKSFLNSMGLSLLLSVVLLRIDLYVFTILQLQDFALLLGSMVLFISLAVIMHLSKKLTW